VQNLPASWYYNRAKNMGRSESALATDPAASPSQGALRLRSLGSTLPVAITPHLTLWRLLGEGGVSRVYEAHDRRFARRVAVKLLGIKEEQNQTARERLLREAELYARIEDVRTPRVYEVSSLGDGTPYVVMEYVAGQSLAELLDRERPNLPLAAEITAEILSALAAVHRHNVVHRDVKPSNIILEHTLDGRLRARLVDFGIAKASSFSMQLTQPGALIGTPQYMAPEQLAGADVDGRADLYASALVFYEMLTGEGPHRKSSIGDLVASRMRDDVDMSALERVQVPGALREFLRRALDRDPGARFGSAEEMLCELHAARAEQHCAWLSPPSVAPAPSKRAPLPLVARASEESSRPPPGVALDASGLHDVADDATGASARPRARAVKGLLLGFGLTFAVGAWMLHGQSSGDPAPEPNATLQGAAEQPAAPAPSSGLGSLPEARPSSAAPAVVAPDTFVGSEAAPASVEAPALAPGAITAPPTERPPAAAVQPARRARSAAVERVPARSAPAPHATTPKIKLRSLDLLDQRPASRAAAREESRAPVPAARTADDVQPNPY
jgi:serine/threonine-protein kinase